MIPQIGWLFMADGIGAWQYYNNTIIIVWMTFWSYGEIFLSRDILLITTLACVN